MGRFRVVIDAEDEGFTTLFHSNDCTEAFRFLEFLKSWNDDPTARVVKLSSTPGLGLVKAWRNG